MRPWPGGRLRQAAVARFGVRDESLASLAPEIAAPVFDPEAPGRVIGAVLGLYDWRRGANLAERIRQSEAALESTVDVLILAADGVEIGRAHV